jgi:hypothetical protein
LTEHQPAGIGHFLIPFPRLSGKSGRIADGRFSWGKPGWFHSVWTAFRLSDRSIVLEMEYRGFRMYNWGEIRMWIADFEERDVKIQNFFGREKNRKEKNS